MDSTSAKREALKKVYPNNPGWASRVNRMPESQVVAIYFRFKNEGKLK